MIDGLKAKMPIGMDILKKKSFTNNTGNKQATIGSCNDIVIPLEVAPQAYMELIQQTLADKDTTIPAKTLGQIPIQSKLPEKRDFFFQPSYTKPNFTVFAQVVNCRMTDILMQNNTDNALIIAGKTWLEQVVEYKADACYRVHINTVGTAPINLQCLIIRNCIAYNNDTSLSTANKIAQIAQKVKPSLWKGTGTTVNLPKGQKDHKIVNTRFDKLHKQGRME